MLTTHVIGGLAALGSAFCWAISAMLFRRIGEQLPALAMNFAKGLVAVCFMALFVLPNGWPEANLFSVFVLALSGIIGIALGDTLYFMTLSRLGARVTLLLSTLIPITAALMAVVFLGERIASSSWLGILITLFGVSYVLWEKAPNDNTKKELQLGLIFAILFVLANAGGIILSKLGVEDISSMEASLLRHVWATVGIGIWGGLAGAFVSWSKPLKSRKLIVQLLIASFIGAFLGSWLSIVALKYTFVSVAAVLNSTSPIFILPLVAIFLKEKISLRSTVGALLAVCGIGIYFVSLG